MIPRRNGVRLLTDVYFSKKAQGKLPVILIRTPYNKNAGAQCGVQDFGFASHGFVVAVQDCRGKSESEGIFSPLAGHERAGFIHLHLITDPSLGGLPSLEPGQHVDPDKTWVSIDCHSVGNTGKGDAACGPSTAGFRGDRADLTIKPDHLFAFEFVAVTVVPEWNGWALPVNLEDDAMVTEDGVQWVYPPNKWVLLVSALSWLSAYRYDVLSSRGNGVNFGKWIIE